VTFEVLHDDGHQDDASFGLYGSSFDTLSDTGAALSLSIDDCATTDASNRHSDRPTDKNGNRLLSPSAMPTSGCLNDIDLPELNSHPDNLQSSELSLGDLSPIKLVYSKGSVPTIERRVMLYTNDANQNDEVDFDWRSDEVDLFHNSSQSNPFYVLRSARKAFDSIRYRLPCLVQPSAESNNITMSDFGSIRQYKCVVVSCICTLIATSLLASFPHRMEWATTLGKRRAHCGLIDRVPTSRICHLRFWGNTESSLQTIIA
jgi:hypothetical protein